MNTESLLIDNKHLLPAPWYHYPVLKEGQFETIELLKKRSTWAGSTIRVGVQDGVWTLGYSFLGQGCNPGRKWGEFNSRQDAITYFVKSKLPELEALKKQKDHSYSLKQAEINEMISNMEKLLSVQLQLF